MRGYGVTMAPTHLWFGHSELNVDVHGCVAVGTECIHLHGGWVSEFLHPSGQDRYTCLTRDPPIRGGRCAWRSRSVARQSSAATPACHGVIFGQSGRQPGEWSAASSMQHTSIVRYICRKSAAAASATASMPPSHANGTAIANVKAVARCGSACLPETSWRPSACRARSRVDLVHISGTSRPIARAGTPVAPARRRRPRRPAVSSAPRPSKRCTSRRRR